MKLSDLYSLSVNLPAFIIAKNLQSECIWVSKLLSSSLGFRCPEELHGKKNEEIEIFNTKIIDQLYINDKHATSGKNWVGFEECATVDYSSLMLFSTKIPLLNQKDEIGGIFCCAIPLNNDQSFGFNSRSIVPIEFSKPNDCTNVDKFLQNHNKRKLTPREIDVLLHVIRGKTAKQIAKSLLISSRTVEGYVNNLKSKFNCYNKSQLIERAINEGYGEIIL